MFKWLKSLFTKVDFLDRPIEQRLLWSHVSHVNTKRRDSR